VDKPVAVMLSEDGFLLSAVILVILVFRFVPVFR
jgi:hypothetical protein